MGAGGRGVVTWEELLHTVVEGVQGLIPAVMVFDHFHGGDFAIRLQIQNFVVARKKGLHFQEGGGGVLQRNQPWQVEAQPY